jgi:hypothetical protein
VVVVLEIGTVVWAPVAIINTSISKSIIAHASITVICRSTIAISISIVSKSATIVVESVTRLLSIGSVISVEPVPTSILIAISIHIAVSTVVSVACTMMCAVLTINVMLHPIILVVIIV